MICETDALSFLPFARPSVYNRTVLHTYICIVTLYFFSEVFVSKFRGKRIIRWDRCRARGKSFLSFTEGRFCKVFDGECLRRDHETHNRRSNINFLNSHSIPLNIPLLLAASGYNSPLSPSSSLPLLHQI